MRALLLAGASTCLWVAPVFAQADDGELEAVSQPVVQAIPGGATMRLNTALAALARNPRDLAALIEAGQASVAMGDTDAAIGFLRRADQIQPGSAAIKANLAAAYVQADDPFTAIPLFAEAEAKGPIDPRLLSARGLAYDLVGDNEQAQRFYRQALATNPDDETARRLAVSLAISGDRRGMDLALAPLLQRQDRAAWRTRAFGFAILGTMSEAEALAQSSLPMTQASAMIAYLRYMPRLTASQKAAAAILGQFPRAAEIGRDDPRVAAFARPKAVVAVAPPPPPAPARRLSRREREQAAKLAEAQRALAARTPPSVPQPVATSATATGELPPRTPVRVAIADPRPVPPAPAPAPAPVPAPVAMTPPAPIPAPTPAPVVVRTVTPQPGFDLAQVTPVTAPAPAPAPAPVMAAAQPPIVLPAPAPPPVRLAAAPTPPPAPAARPRNLADVFADLTPPSREIEQVSGAVDLRRLTAAEKKAADAKAAAAKTAAAKTGKDAKDAKETKDPKAEAKRLAAAQPSRIWVQLAASQNKAGLPADFRRFSRAEDELFKGRKGYTSAWGQATRLLTGPFDSEKAASAFAAQLKKAGMGGVFVWTSPAGQVVDALPAGR